MASPGFPRTSPFIDRERELEEMQTSIEKTVSGEGGLILLAGEAGIGKTRLSELIRDYAVSREVRCLTARCSNATATIPYFPWVQLIREFLQSSTVTLFYRVAGNHVATILNLVPELLPTDSDVRPTSPKEFTSLSQQDRIRFFQSLSDFFVRLSKESPLLLIFDDLHWADSASLDFLHHIASKLPDNPFSIVGTFRDTELEEGSQAENPHLSQLLSELGRERSSSTIKLKRFDPEKVAGMVSGILGRTGQGEQLYNLIYKKTGGNPFFVEEVLRSLIEDEAFQEPKSGTDRRVVTEIEIPGSVKSIIGERLRHLDAETLSSLSIAAVIGQEFNHELLHRIAVEESGGDITGVLNRASKRGLIKEKTSGADQLIYTFSDELVREILYGELITAKRREYHLRIVIALEEIYKDSRRGEHLEELAFHSLVANEPRRALEYSARAGQRAMELYAYRMAIGHLKTTLELIEKKDSGEGLLKPDFALRARCEEQLGDASAFTGDISGAFRYWNDAAAHYRELGESLREGVMHRHIGFIAHFVLNDGQGALEFYTKAIGVFEKLPKSKELAYAHALMGVLRLFRNERTEAIVALRKALRMAKVTEAYQAESLADAAFAFTMLLPEKKKSFGYLQRSLDVAVAHDLLDANIIARFFLGHATAIIRCDSEAAERQYIAGIEYAKKSGYPIISFMHLADLAYYVYLPRGEWQKARQTVDELLRSFDLLSIPARILTFCVLAQLHLLRGEMEKSEENFQRALPLVTKGFNDLELVAPLYSGLGRLYMEMGDKARAGSYLNEGYETSKGSARTIRGAYPFSVNCALLIELALSERNLDRAESLLAEMWKVANSLDEKWCYAYVNRAEGMLNRSRGRWDEAVESLGKSLAIWRELKFSYEIGRTLHELGLVYQQVENVQAAKEALGEGLRIFSGLGASIDVARTQSVLSRDVVTIDSSLLKSETSRAIFDYLLRSFLHDYKLARLQPEQAGWRSLTEISKSTGSPRYAVYGRKGGVGPLLQELIQDRFVETRFFRGERGRGGEVIRARVAYGQQEIKRYIDQKAAFGW